MTAVGSAKGSDCSSMFIFADCSYSGNWVKEGANHGYYCSGIKNTFITAACLPDEKAYDTEDGGMFTLVKCGKKKKKNFSQLSRCKWNTLSCGSGIIYMDKE